MEDFLHASYFVYRQLIVMGVYRTRFSVMGCNLFFVQFGIIRSNKVYLHSTSYSGVSMNQVLLTSKLEYLRCLNDSILIDSIQNNIELSEEACWVGVPVLLIQCAVYIHYTF